MRTRHVTTSSSYIADGTRVMLPKFWNALNYIRLTLNTPRHWPFKVTRVICNHTRAGVNSIRNWNWTGIEPKWVELKLELELTFWWSGIGKFHFQFHQFIPPVTFCDVIQIYTIQCSHRFSNTAALCKSTYIIHIGYHINSRYLVAIKN